MVRCRRYETFAVGIVCRECRLVNIDIVVIKSSSEPGQGVRSGSLEMLWPAMLMVEGPALDERAPPAQNCGRRVRPG